MISSCMLSAPDEVGLITGGSCHETKAPWSMPPCVPGGSGEQGFRLRASVSRGGYRGNGSKVRTCVLCTPHLKAETPTHQLRCPPSFRAMGAVGVGVSFSSQTYSPSHLPSAQCQNNSFCCFGNECSPLMQMTL